MADLNWLQRGLVSALGLRSLAENPSVSLADPRVIELWGGDRSATNITRENALTVAAFSACVSLIGSSFSKLPVKVYRRDGEGNMTRQPNDYRETLLGYEPVPFQTSMAWRAMGIVHLATYGNFYNLIERNREGKVLNLMPIDPTRVTIKRVGRDVFYDIQLDEKDSKGKPRIERHSQENILHIRVEWLLKNGLMAESPVTLLKTDLDTLAALQLFTKNYFENGAMPGSAFTFPKSLSDTAYGNLKKSIQEKFGGATNSHKPFLIEEGGDVKILAQTFDETFIALQERAKRNVCAALLVPPGMVGEERDVNRSTAEQDSLRFAIHTLSAWVNAWEQEINRKLFPRSPLFVRFDMDDLTRGDLATRHEAYSKALGGQPYMTINEVRAKENMSAVGNGDDIKEPLNMGNPGGDPGSTTNDQQD